MVCNSLPKWSSTTSPSAKLSAVVSEKACNELLCKPRSGAGRFRMVKANEGSLPSSILWLKEARRTEAGETPPYPMLPCNPIVSEEKIDRSSEKPVPKSEALPKPSAAEPATSDRLPRQIVVTLLRFASQLG